MADEQPIQRKTFDLGSYLQANNLQLVNRDETGKVFVKDASFLGQEEPQPRELDLDGLISTGLGMNPKELDIQFNTPDTALNIAPNDQRGLQGIVDRLKLSVGNNRGRINFLKKKYDDVTVDPDRGLVVKEDGIWKPVDPEGTFSVGDPWEFAKDFADLTDIGISTTGAIIGSVKGAATAGAAGGVVAGPPGALVAGVAGGIVGAGTGGVAASTIRTSLGRIAGTYDATPSEQIADVALETAINMGGELIPVGGRWGLSKFVKAGKKLGNIVNETSRGVITEVLGRTTGVGPDAFDVYLQNSAKVAREMKNVSRRSGSVRAGEIQNLLKKDQLNLGTKILEDGIEALPRKYGEILDQMRVTAEGAGKPLSVDVKSVIGSSIGKLEEQGFGKVRFSIIQKGTEKDVSEELIRAFTGSKANLAQAGAPLRIPKGAKISVKLQPFDEFETVQRIQQGLPVERLPNEVLQDTNQILQEFGDLTAITTKDALLKGKKAGIFEGKAAVNVLTDMNKKINAIERDIFKGKKPASLERFATMLNENFRNGVSAEFDKIGLNTQFEKANKLYSEFSSAVSEGRTILRKDGEEAYIKRITQNFDRFSKPKDRVAKLVELGGKNSERAYEDIIIKETASRFSPWAPRGLLANLGGGAGAIAVATGSVDPLLMFGIAPQFSPRIVGAEVRAAIIAKNKMLDFGNFMKQLPPEQLKELATNPELFKAAFRIPVQAAQDETQGPEQLLIQSGAVPVVNE